MTNMDKEHLLARFLAGTYSKKALLAWLVPMILVTLLLPLFIADLIYPHPYDWRYIMISSLSSNVDNPGAHSIPSFGGLVAGILMIGLLGYFQKKLGRICRGTTGVGTAF